MIRDRTIGIIVAVNKDGVIGKDNDLPWRYKGDLKWFKEKTKGATVIMGRKTWESLPVKPLPDRENIILSSSQGIWDIEQKEGIPWYKVGDVTDDIELVLARHPCDDIWFMGGARVYQEALKYADTLLATVVPDKVSGTGLVHFPLNVLPWQTRGKIPWKEIRLYQHPYEPTLNVLEARREPLKMPWEKQ